MTRAGLSLTLFLLLAACTEQPVEIDRPPIPAPKADPAPEAATEPEPEAEPAPESPPEDGWLRRSMSILVSGTVRYAPEGESAKGVPVRLEVLRYDSAQVRNVRVPDTHYTSGAGTFVREFTVEWNQYLDKRGIRLLPPIFLTAVAECDVHGLARSRIFTLGRSQVIGVEMVFGAELSISGHLVSEGRGHALSGVEVSLYDENRRHMLSVTTDEEGLFVFDDLSPGPYELRAHPEGHQELTGSSPSRPFTVRVGADGGAFLAEVPLPALPTVSMRLLDNQTGEPIRNTPVSFRGYAVQQMDGYHTDDDGRVTLTASPDRGWNPRSPREVRFHAQGYYRGEVSAVLELNEHTDAGDVKLDPLSVVRGKVVDLDGNPVAGAEVRLHRYVNGGPWDHIWDVASKGYFEATTDADGNFQVPGVADGKVVVRVIADGYADYRGTRTVPMKNPVYAELGPGATVTGTVDASSLPPGETLKVYAVPNDVPYARWLTRWPGELRWLKRERTAAVEDGQFRFEHLPVGGYYFVVVSDPGTYSDLIHAVAEHGSTSELRFSFSDRPELRVRVTYNGEPAAGYTVMARGAYPRRGAEHEFTATTNAEGVAEFTDLPQGRYELTVKHGRTHASNSYRTIILANRQATTISIRLPD